MARRENKPVLVLLDGHAIIHRAYYAMRDQPFTVRRTGEPVSAVYGLASTIIGVLNELRPTHAGVALDPEGPTFRHEKDETYKAQRPDMPEDLAAQLGRCEELIDAFELPIYRVEGFEADDVLGTLARQAAEKGIETYVVTLDSDLVQVVQPGVRVYMFRPYQRDAVLYDEARTRERYGIKPQQVPDLKALKGDASDNIVGVPGVGEKTAAKLIQQFGGVEGVYARLDEVQPEKLRESLRTHEKQARHSKEMATVHTGAPVELDLDSAALERFDRDKLLSLFHELEFRSLVDRLPDWLGEGEKVGAPVDVRPSADVDYRAVQTEEALDSLARRLAGASSFAFDTETDALGAIRAVLVGLSFSPASGEAYYVPVGHRPMLGSEEQLPLATVLARLGPILEDAAIEKVAHNGKFDMVVLANQGAQVRNLAFDTMIAAYILGEGGGAESYRPGAGSLGLKWLASKRLNVEMTPITDLIGRRGPKQLGMDQVAIADATPYACADADMTLRLREGLEAELKAQDLWRLFNEMEMPLVPVLTRMELAGVALDTSVLRQMSRQLDAQVREVEERIYEEVGHHFNIGSPQQLSSVLFEDLGLPKTRRMKQGYSTDAQALEGLRGAHAAIDLVLEWRQLTKLKSTYVDTLPALIHPKTGRVHTTFNQTITATGRLSSNDPNLQNIPVRTELGGQVRSAFVARDIGPDACLFSADYSQIELRILAHLCQDPSLLKAFREDEDIHAATASEVFGVAMDEVTPDMRRRAKVFNFGVLYGLSEFGLSQREGIPREEAAEFIKTYYAKYERIKGWQERVVADTRRLGYAETLAGRRRYLPEIKSSNRQVRAAAERMAVNMPIQGTASDIIKIAMNRIDAEIEERGMRSKMLLQVHDELIFEGPASELDDLRELTQRIMPGSLSLDVPLKVDVKVGRNWGEMG